MKPRRPSDFEVFNKQVSQVLSKSDSIIQDSQKSIIPYKLKGYFGTADYYFSDNGAEYVGSYTVVFRYSDLPVRINAYNKLKNSTYCKPFVKPGTSNVGDGVKKYYPSSTFTDGSTLNVSRYLKVETVYSSELNEYVNLYYFIGDGKDGTITGVKYYIREAEVVSNYLVPFNLAVEDNMVYGMLLFINGFFIPWTKCYVAISYEDYRIVANLEGLKTNSTDDLFSEDLKNNLKIREIDPVVYVLPFSTVYKEYVKYDNITTAERNKSLFIFDQYGRLCMSYTNAIPSGMYVNYISAGIEIQTVNAVNRTSSNPYDQVSNLFYCEARAGTYKEYTNEFGSIKVNTDKINRMRRLFPENVIVFNRTSTSPDLNLTLCDDDIRVYNNIVYVGTGEKTYYDQHVKVFIDMNSDLSFSNLEFTSQNWLEKYTNNLIEFYKEYKISYIDNEDEIVVGTNESKSVGLIVEDGQLCIAYDPEASASYSMINPTQLGYTIKNGLLSQEYDTDNSEPETVIDRYISEEAKGGEIYINYSMDMDSYNFDTIECIYRNSRTRDTTQLPIDKAKFFNPFNKVYHNDVYNRNKGLLPVMDQTTPDSKFFIFKYLGQLTSIYKFDVGKNVSLKCACLNDSTFIDKINEMGITNPIGFYKFVYRATNSRNDRYGDISIDEYPTAGSTFNDVIIRSARLISIFMYDDLDSPLGIRTGFIENRYYGLMGYTVYTDYTFSTQAPAVEHVIDSDHELMKVTEVFLDIEHNSYYFKDAGISYYMKEYSDETYDSTTGKSTNKTGTYQFYHEENDYSGMLVVVYDPGNNAPQEARMNNVQLSNTIINIYPNDNTTADLSRVKLDINNNKYISNFIYSTDPIVTNFICSGTGSLKSECDNSGVTYTEATVLSNVGYRTGDYTFTYDSDLSKWRLNGGGEVVLSDWDITYSGTDPFTITVSNDTYPTWTLNSTDVDLEDTYGITVNGICEIGNILSITFSKTVTGLLEENYDPDAQNPQYVTNEYLHLILNHGINYLDYDNYYSEDNVDPYKLYPGRIEFTYDGSKWIVDVYRYILDDLIYKYEYEYDNLEGWGIEYSGTAIAGDKFIVYYTPPVFKWYMYKALPKIEPPIEREADIYDYINTGYYYSETPTLSEITDLTEYGIGTICTISQTSVPSARITSDALFATMFNGEFGTYRFVYSGFKNSWTYDNENIILSEYGISIGDVIPNDGDYIVIELDTSSTPEWMDSLFVTIYERNPTAIQFPDGTYYNTDTAIEIIKNLYGFDISNYRFIMNINDTFEISYYNAVNIPRYVLNLLINKFDYKNIFESYSSDVKDTFLPEYTTYDEKVNDLFKNYKLYEYQLATMLYNNSSIFNDYLRTIFASNIRFSEYVWSQIKTLTNNTGILNVPVKNKTVGILNFENLYLNPSTDINLPVILDPNNTYGQTIEYVLGSPLNSNNNMPVEFIYFDDIDNSERTITIDNDSKYYHYDTTIINNNMRLYTQSIPSDNEFEYPEGSDMYFNVEFTLDQLRYKGIIKAGNSVDNTTYTPKAAKGDFYYIDNSGYINGVSVTKRNLLVCTADVYDASEGLFDNIGPDSSDGKSWRTYSGPSLINGITDIDDDHYNYSALVLDEVYTRIILTDTTKYNTSLVMTSDNRFKYQIFTYNASDPDIDDGIILDENTFRYCDNTSKYIVFAEDSSGILRFISSDQYRVSVPNVYDSPFYNRKIFFSFTPVNNKKIYVLYLPVEMEAVEFKKKISSEISKIDSTVIFDIDYETKKNIHYTLDSEMYMIFADGRKIPQSWIKKIGPDRIQVSNHLPSGSISYNNISIVRFIPSTLSSRFDTYYDYGELDTLPNDSSTELMKYAIKEGLTKDDILNIIEKINYRQRYSMTGSEYRISDDLNFDNYGYGMAEFIYWLYKDTSLTPEQRLAVFDYSKINMDNANAFGNNKRYIESTMRMIRDFYVENTLVVYNNDDVTPTFNNQDNISTKSGGLTTNTKYANDSDNTYVYPAMQDYRVDFIYATYNLTNLTTNGDDTISPGEINYEFNLYTEGGSMMPEEITITMGGRTLVVDEDYSYNKGNGKVNIFSATNDFIVTAVGERIYELRITKQPNIVNYFDNEPFDPSGMIITAYWYNGAEVALTPDDITVVNAGQILTPGTTQQLVTYVDSGITYTIAVDITVTHCTPELEYEYSNEYDGYIITGLSNQFDTSINTDLVIPDRYNGKPVVVIGANAFYGYTNIDEVSISKNTEIIRNSAFRECSLTSINLISGITDVEDSAFYGCTNLTSLAFMDSVTYIGAQVAYGCINITSIHLPRYLTGIQERLAYGCTSLVTVHLPEELTTLGEESFYGCTAIETINLPDGLESIKARAFYGCVSLNNVVIPNNVTSIEDEVFYGCSGLDNITFGTGLTSIGTRGLGMSGLTTVVLPNTITKLGNQVLYNCSNLDTVYLKFGALDDKIDIAQNSWFFSSSGISTIYVPSSVYASPATAYGTYWNYYSTSSTIAYAEDV